MIRSPTARGFSFGNDMGFVAEPSPQLSDYRNETESPTNGRDRWRRRKLLIPCRNSQRLNKTYFPTSKMDTGLKLIRSAATQFGGVRNKIPCGSRTCKPNSVCRCRQDDHSSGPRITTRLKRPTRRSQRTEPARAPVFWSSLPIWSCSVWGLPCPHDYSYGGALLPHLFTLT
jgi:hypothetical protein